MTHEVAIHPAQNKILRELLFLPATRFSVLQKVTGLESDHAKFHIKRLVELGYVDKKNNTYKLSIKGKEYANKLDTDNGSIERQPKIAVMLIIERERNGQKEYLLQQRHKHPFYGFWGAPTGKVRWGESILTTASRELMEETGLQGIFEHRSIFHERVKHEITGEIIEDKVFHIMYCNKVSGKLITECESGHNKWRTMESMQNKTKTYKSFFLEMNLGLEATPFYELLHSYSEEEF